MSRTAKFVILICTLLFVPLVIWGVASGLHAVQQRSGARTQDAVRRSQMCVDEAGLKYSQGALVRAKAGVVKCDGGRWVMMNPSK
jgi:hypothetical protein